MEEETRLDIIGVWARALDQHEQLLVLLGEMTLEERTAFFDNFRAELTGTPEGKATLPLISRAQANYEAQLARRSEFSF